MKCTLAEYVAQFLVENGITKVFAIQGGGSARLIDALGSTEGVEYICNQHEQASAMSADGYARVSGRVGCALSTSGPGATNMLTGVCGAYFDSIPVLFITGQVSSTRLKGNFKVRNMHTQETDVVDIFRPVTKYAVALKNPYDIRYELEKCIFFATEGRPGPVVIDIPDDYQRAEVDTHTLSGFFESKDFSNHKCEKSIDFARIIDMISASKRPIIIAGWGIHIAKAEEVFTKVVEQLNIPTVFTWAANDILPEEHPLKIGTIGMNGSTAGNMAVKNADLLIILGTKMDHHSVIVQPKNFATGAKKIIVDIDHEEIRKLVERGCEIDYAVEEDLLYVLRHMDEYLVSNSICFEFEEWKQPLVEMKARTFEDMEKFHADNSIVNPYQFVHTLSECIKENEIIFMDTGSSLVWMEQAFLIKAGQRLHSSLNNTPMGYALPAAIGAAIASGGRVYSVNGDGGLQMNLQELATIVRHELDIKVILFDNSGYGMVQRTQDAYMGSRYYGTDVGSGLAFPDFERLFKVYGFDVLVIENDDCEDQLLTFLKKKGPACVIVKVSIEESYITFHPDDISIGQ